MEADPSPAQHPRDGISRSVPRSQESLHMAEVGGSGPPPEMHDDVFPDALRLDEDEALVLAQEASLKTSTDASLNDKMLESEMRHAQQLSLRQSQADAARAREREEDELRLALEASMESSKPAASTPSAATSKRTAAAEEEPEYRQNYG